MKLLNLSFLPASVDFGLLLLRLHVGLAMLCLHGWTKAMKFDQMMGSFPSPFPWLPSPAAFSLVIFAELFCSLLLILGFLTRFAALVLLINMSVAFLMAHGAKVSGPGSGEMALLYLGMYAVLLVAGAGRFSLDRR